MIDIEAIKNFSIDKSDWKQVKFGDVVFEPKDSTKDPVADGIEHVVGLEHIDSEDIHLRRFASIEDSTTFTKIFAKGDVLFGRRRAYLKKAALADFEGICSGDITVMRAKDELLPRLLPIIVSNDKFFDYAVTHSAGGLSPRVKFKDLSKYMFHLPPKNIQKELIELFFSVDDSEISNIKLFNSFKRSNESLINDKCFGVGCDKTKKTCIGDIPVDWDVNTLDEITISITKGTTPSSIGHSFINEGVNFIKVESITKSGIFIPSKFEHIDETTHNALNRSKLIENDILFSIAGALGRSAIVTSEICPANTNQALSIIRLKEGIYPLFIYYFLKTNFILRSLEKLKVQAAQPNLSLKNIKDFNVPIPPYEEQIRIVSEISKVESLGSKIRNKMDSFILVKKSILNQVF